MGLKSVSVRKGWLARLAAPQQSLVRMWIGVIVIPLILILVLVQLDVINAYYYDVLMRTAIAVIMAVSFNMVNGQSGQFGLGHAGFMGVGAYIAGVLITGGNPGYAGIELRVPGFLSTLPVLAVGNYLFAPGFLLATLIGGLAAAMVGFVISIPAFRTRGDYLAVITLAFNMIIVNIFLNMDYVGGARGLTGLPSYSNIIWVWLFMMATVIISRNLIQSSHGRAILSVRENEVAAEIGGIDIHQYKLIAFTIAAFFAGIGGALLGFHVQFINPSMFNIFKTFDFLIMIYLGGIGSITGTAVGAVIWTLLQEILRPVLSTIGVSPEWRLVIGPVLLVVLMLFRPKGLIQRELPFIDHGEEDD